MEELLVLFGNVLLHPQDGLDYDRLRLRSHCFEIDFLPSWLNCGPRPMRIGLRCRRLIARKKKPLWVAICILLWTGCILLIVVLQIPCILHMILVVAGDVLPQLASKDIPEHILQVIEPPPH